MSTVIPMSVAARTMSNRGAAYRMMFLGFFGTLWTVIGCIGYYGVSAPSLGIALLCGLSIVSLGWLLRAAETRQRHRSDKDGGDDSYWHSRGRAFRNINIAQGIAIVSLVLALSLLGRPEWINVGILLIVGLHFLPLAKLFGNRANLVTGLALIVIALVMPLAAPAGVQSPAIPLLAGLILWSSALMTLVGAIRHINE